MVDFKEIIKEKRPKLSATSVKTYDSILRNLYKSVFGGDVNIDVAKLNDHEKVLRHLRLLAPSKRKTILSALVIITDDKVYRDLMMDDINAYKTEIAKQEKTPSQRENWVEVNDIKVLWTTLKKNSDLLYKKAHLTSGDLQQIQSFIILSLLGGIFIAPRRALDYVHFKIRGDINKEQDNFLDKATLIFNSYKTSKYYGQQKVTIPLILKNLLSKWIKVNPTDYLLFDVNMNPLTSVKLNQRLNKLFDGKKVSVNALRHSFLTDKYGSMIQTTKDLANDLSNMGSSMQQAQTYIKDA